MEKKEREQSWDFKSKKNTNFLDLCFRKSVLRELFPALQWAR